MRKYWFPFDGDMSHLTKDVNRMADVLKAGLSRCNVTGDDSWGERDDA